MLLIVNTVHKLHVFQLSVTMLFVNFQIFTLWAGPTLIYTLYHSVTQLTFIVVRFARTTVISSMVASKMAGVVKKNINIRRPITSSAK